MLALGIETSCDETGLAILEFDQRSRACVVRSELVASQVELHQLYGGVVPELASREHLRNLPFLLDEVVVRAGISLRDLDCICVTCGPGLKGCLLIGVTFAQGLQIALATSTRQIPLLGVNHIEAHILTCELHNRTLQPPYLALVVSGGHTEIVLVSELGRYQILARTLDDAAGEAFDKSANLLGLEYPGGPRLAAFADSTHSSRFALPKVSRELDDFSFSGLKTAVMLLVRKNQEILTKDPDAQAEAAWAIQNAILDPLVHKVLKEVRRAQLPLIVCGGVSANAELRRRLIDALGANVMFAPLEHCGDNGVMIAYTGGRYHLEQKQTPTLAIHSRWPVESLSVL